MERINIDTLPETNVDWYADGERANAVVLNRPIKQVAGIVNTLIDTVNGQIPINDPTFTGTPTAPTAADGTSTTQLATTAFVQTATNTRIASGEKGAATGVATLDDTGKVPSTQLPIHYPQPSMTGSATLMGNTYNKIHLNNIVTTLGLEVGDVIRIQCSGYDKMHAVEYIDTNTDIVVNYEHAGNRGNGSLKIPNTTATTTITRIAKWYNAPLGLGQAWMDMKANRFSGDTYTNSTGRTIFIYVAFSDTSVDGLEVNINGVRVFKSSDLIANQYHPISIPIPAGGTYRCYIGTGDGSARANLLCWMELR